MFWGCFSGKEKGPYVFWEKDWGTVNAESYAARVVPLVDGWIRTKAATPLTFMQDNASAHSASITRAELSGRGI